MATVYCLLKNIVSGEMHLFEGPMHDDGNGCRVGRASICQKMKLADSHSDIFTCRSEESARESCAELGRTVCGTCVSHLYASYS